MYSLIRKLLFQIDAEKTHKLAMTTLSLGNQLGLNQFIFAKPISNPKKVMNILFPNPIGLSAGFDRNGDYIDALAPLGFGFIEIGTITPRPQTGHQKPRLFRLEAEHALINRIGFESKGMEHVAKQLENMRYRGVLGINIGKNRDTPIEKAIDDYLLCFNRLWKYASYITINISSPNTPNLRDLQEQHLLTSLLENLKLAQTKIAEQENKYVPLVVKISADVRDEQFAEIAQVLLTLNIDGVIVANTTIHREGVEKSPYANEAGGLSGQPLFQRNLRSVQILHPLLQNKIPIIGCGGIMNEENAREMFTAGAELLEVYTGFIYAGPSLIPRLAAL